MDFKSFKTSLFGFSKMEVCSYISDTTAEFSKLMLQNNTKYEADIAALRDEVARLKAQNAELYAKQQQINQVLIDTRTYADQLRREAEEEAARLRAENQNAYKREKSRVISYRGKLDAVRGSLREMLLDVEGKLDVAADELIVLAKESLGDAWSEAAISVEDTADGGYVQEAEYYEYDEDSNDPILDELPSIS